MPRPNRPAQTLILGLSLLLAACSGLPDAGTTPASGAPTVTVQTAGGQAVSDTMAVGPAAAVRLKVADVDGMVKTVNWKLMQGGTQVTSGSVPAAQIKATIDLNLPTLRAGEYTLTVSAVDDRGLTGSAKVTLVVDAVAPTLTEVTVNGAAVQPGASLTQPVGQTLTLSAKATDDVSAAPTVNVYWGSKLIASGQGEVTADLTGSAATTAGYTVVTVDSVGNSATQSLTVNYTADSTVTPAPSPKIVINNTGAQPYSNILSVTTSAGVSAGVGTKQLILEVTDAKGIVDTTTYSTTSETASFNIDTTKYPDGALTLKAIAVDAKDQRGTSTPTVVQIANAVAPTITIVAPTNGADVSGPTQVTVQVRQNNTAFSFDPAPTATLKVQDGRGQDINTQSVPLSQVNTGLWQGVATVDFNDTQYLNAPYTLRASASVIMAGKAAQPITAVSTVSNRSAQVEPPALNILLPAYFEAVASKTTVLTSKSAVALMVSDSNEIRQVQLQFVCDDVATPGCNRVAYNFNIPLGKAGLFYPVFNTGVLIDGQPYVPDGKYIMRATAVDVTGYSNIKEMPVTVDRSQAGIATLGYNTITTTNDGFSKFVPTTATWAIKAPGSASNGVSAHNIRALTLTTDDGVLGVGIDPQVASGAVFSTTVAFGKAGSFGISYLLQDMNTGVVEYYPGGALQIFARQ